MVIPEALASALLELRLHFPLLVTFRAVYEPLSVSHSYTNHKVFEIQTPGPPDGSYS